MLKNYTTETYIKTFVPELTRYLWPGETTYDAQKQAAEQQVTMDFISSSYKALALRPDLYLRTATATLSADETGTSYEDKCQRLRLAYNVTVRSGTTALVLQGSNDETTWTTITTQSITATGESSFCFITAFKYYRINATITAGTLAFTAWLTETIFDLFFAYKWLEGILMNAGKTSDSKYTEYAKYFLEMYNALWQKGIIWQDTDSDGVADEEDKFADITFGR
jgi:hypothetical protein